MRQSISRARANRWLTLFVVTRVAATAVGTTLLIARQVTDHDGLLIALGIAYGGASVVAALRWDGVRRRPAVWATDTVIVLSLILASDQWRSPFYLLALTSLVLPAVALPFKGALAWGGAFTASYFVVALATGIDWQTLETTARLESFVTHFMVPLLVVVTLAYSGGLLRRLEEERNRSAQLMLETERRRIALELHDSAKQRIHAAHLMLSSLARSSNGSTISTVDHAMQELRAAATDLDANLSELRAPLGSRGLEFALRERAAELESAAGGPSIDVAGTVPELPTFLAAHVFYVVSEAMTNAARHSGADRIRVKLGFDNGSVQAVISDDGSGMPGPADSTGPGIRSMTERAEILGGTLTISATNNDMKGTTVRFVVPLSDSEADV
jgi:signal transduction histidine kinase